MNKRKILCLMGIIGLMVCCSGCGKSLEEQVIQEDSKIKINTSEVDYTKFFKVADGSEIDIITKDDSGVDLTKCGTYKVTMLLQKENKAETVDYDFEVFDDEAPVLSQKGSSIVVNMGDELSPNDYVKVSDNSGEEIIPDADISEVDLSKQGDYEIKYTAVDASGNSSDLTVPVTVLKNYKFKEMQKLCKKLIKKKKYNLLKIYNFKKKFIDVYIPSIGLENVTFTPWTRGREYRYGFGCVISNKNYGIKNRKSKYFQSDFILTNTCYGSLDGSSPTKKAVIKTKNDKVVLTYKFAEKLEGKAFNWYRNPSFFSAQGSALCFESEEQINILNKICNEKTVKMSVKVVVGQGDSLTLAKRDVKAIKQLLNFYKEINKYIRNYPA